MTSNQGIAYNEALKPSRGDIVKAAIDYVKNQNPDGVDNGDEFLQDVVDVLTILLGKEVYPYISGNVHAQTSPSAAYDTERTVAHAKKLVQLFAAHNIPRERVCIKIPATPQSLIACQRLAAEGIQTLATCLFSVPQAVAAAQAGCIYSYFPKITGIFSRASTLRVASRLFTLYSCIINTFNMDENQRPHTVHDTPTKNQFIGSLKAGLSVAKASTLYGLCQVRACVREYGVRSERQT